MTSTEKFITVIEAIENGNREAFLYLTCGLFG